MIIRITVSIVVALVFAASSWAQGVMLNFNEDGSYVEAGYLSNRFGAGGGAGLGFTRGALDLGIECGFMGGDYVSSTSIAQEAAFDFTRLSKFESPVSFQLREAVGLSTNSNITLALGPALYLRAVDPLGATCVVGGGVSVLQGLSGGSTREAVFVSDMSLALGYRTGGTCVSVVGSASFGDYLTTYSLGLNFNFIGKEARFGRVYETWE